MGKFAKRACYMFVLVSVLAVKVRGRFLQLASSPELVSDGMGVEYCEEMYGFLPCSNNVVGHLFLIVVYEYLLFHGESYVASGAERIFKILGTGVFGASAFHILGALPEASILLVSGLLDSKETARDYVNTGVGQLAGSTIFLLTLLWGTCVIAGRADFSSNFSSNPSLASTNNKIQIKRLLSHLTGSGITTDLETSYTARIVVLSVIPFIIILLPAIFHISTYGEHIVIIFALIVSLIFLLLYFFYQFFQPWIQKRRLEYMKHEHLVVDILKYVQKHTMERLFTKDGAPNVHALRRLFEEIDKDGDNFISFSEMKQLLQEIKFRNLNWDKEQRIAEVMNEFDLDGDKKITMDEFVDVFTKWLDETKRTMDEGHHSVRSSKDLYQILQPWIQKKRKERQMKKHIIAEIIGRVQNSALGSLFTEDGTPDVSTIKRLFERIDHDGDNCISQPELKALVMDINFGKIPWDEDEAVAKIMEELDINGDQMINEEEFVSGFEKWLNASNSRTPKSTEGVSDMYQKTWDETDMVVEEKSDERSVWAWTNAIMFLVIGIVMLGVLAEPLIQTVEDFSTSASIPSFFVSFVLVPLATNARVAISAIIAARRKKPRTTSLTFSEIYGGVFMNNVLGFSILLFLICFRGLSWHFSAEVLIILLVCAIMGLAASFTSTFPIWSSLVAFILYPLSLLLVYVLDYLFLWP